MKKLLPLLLALPALGCSGGETPPDDSKPAPEVTYKMVPATTGGGGVPTAPAAPAPAPSGGVANPPSAGSD